MNIGTNNILLQEQIDSLTLENDKLKNHTKSLQKLLATNICKFFELVNSIKQTKKRFCYETLKECYRDLVYFYGCTDPIQDADDYVECYKDIFGTKYTNYDIIDNTNNNSDEIQGIAERTDIYADIRELYFM